ncbi:hypothetical protein SH139x_005368 [Planctomycetaceae bacterium SH139]
MTIHAGSALPPALTAKNIELCAHIGSIRRYIHDKNKYDRRTDAQVRYDFPLHDDFYHCAARKHGRKHNFRPHFHVVVVHKPRNLKDSRVDYCFRSQCEERGLTFFHTKRTRIYTGEHFIDGNQPPAGLGNLGYYTSMPFKADQLTEFERLITLLTLPTGIRMIRRKTTGQTFVPKYWNKARPNKDSFHFDPETNSFQPGLRDN